KIDGIYDPVLDILGITVVLSVDNNNLLECSFFVKIQYYIFSFYCFFTAGQGNIHTAVNFNPLFPGWRGEFVLLDDDIFSTLLFHGIDRSLYGIFHVKFHAFTEGSCTCGNMEIAYESAIGERLVGTYNLFEGVGQFYFGPSQYFRGLQYNCGIAVFAGYPFTVEQF